MENHADDRNEARQFRERTRTDEDDGHHGGGDLRVDRRLVDGVQVGELPEERAVAGHGVVEAREDHHAAVERIEDRQNHGGADDEKTGRTEKRIGGSRAEIEVAARHHLNDRVVRKHAVDRPVEEHVEKRHAADRADQSFVQLAEDASSADARLRMKNGRSAKDTASVGLRQRCKAASVRSDRRRCEGTSRADKRWSSPRPPALSRTGC